MADKWFRFEEGHYSGRTLMLVRLEYPVLSQTEHGVWLDILGRRRWVKLDAHKRFACPSEAEALESFRARKRRQVKILRRRLAEAEAALRLEPGDREFLGLDLVV